MLGDNGQTAGSLALDPTATWALMENVFQRRADEIGSPNVNLLQHALAI